MIAVSDIDLFIRTTHRERERDRYRRAKITTQNGSLFLSVFEQRSISFEATFCAQLSH